MPGQGVGQIWPERDGVSDRGRQVGLRQRDREGDREMRRNRDGEIEQWRQTHRETETCRKYRDRDRKI